MKISESHIWKPEVLRIILLGSARNWTIFFDIYPLSCSSFLHISRNHVQVPNAKFLQLGRRGDSSIFLIFQRFIEPSIFVSSNSWILRLFLVAWLSRSLPPYSSRWHGMRLHAGRDACSDVSSGIFGTVGSLRIEGSRGSRPRMHTHRIANFSANARRNSVASQSRRHRRVMFAPKFACTEAIELLDWNSLNSPAMACDVLWLIFPESVSSARQIRRVVWVESDAWRTFE